MSLFENVPCWIRDIPGHLKTQEVRRYSVHGAIILEYVSDHLKTEEMCKEAVRREPYILLYVLSHVMTQDICNEAVRRDPYTLPYVPDHLMTWEVDEYIICYIVGYAISFNVFESRLSQ